MAISLQRDLKIQVRIRIESHIVFNKKKINTNMEKDIITESFLLVSEKNLRIEKRSLEQLQKRASIKEYNI